MGILGSAFGRALSGAAGAAGVMANKYLDDEIATNRAQALADIQRMNGQRMREDEDAFANDPTRVARDRNRKRDDAMAAGKTARDVELEGLTDPTYQGAKLTKADDDAKDATRRKGDEMKTLAPVEAERSGLIAEANARAQAKYREPRVGSKADLAEKVSAIEKALGRPLTEAEKLTALGLAKGAPRDPELDYETVKTRDADTGEERTIKRIRRPGQMGDAPAEDTLKAAMDKARAAKAAPKPGAPAAAGGAAAPAPAAPGVAPDPLAGKTRSQVREIEAQTRNELTRWEGKPGAEKRVNELRAILERIANGQY